MLNRGRKMVMLATKDEVAKIGRSENTFWPYYESTKGLNEEEQRVAVNKLGKIISMEETSAEVFNDDCNTLRTTVQIIKDVITDDGNNEEPKPSSEYSITSTVITSFTNDNDYSFPEESIDSGSDTGTEYIPDSCSSSNSSAEADFRNSDWAQKQLASSPDSVLSERKTQRKAFSGNVLAKNKLNLDLSQNSVSESRGGSSDKEYLTKGYHFCFFCETKVTQFPRHLGRNHSSEIEVAEIMSLSAGHKKRKLLLAGIRKKGDYLFSSIGEVKPIRKPTMNSSKDLLPCIYCLGFYAKKQLWRHKKHCAQRPINAKSFTLSESQSLLSKTPVDKRLKEIVFPRMRADAISLTAKKDVLICAYGSRYLKTHREQHQISVVSRKLRELGKLLHEVKKIDPKIQNMFEALRPHNFDKIVEATKAAASFNQETEKYGAPSYAMNISTSLKDCCEVAIAQINKRKHVLPNKTAGETEEELKTTMLLIKSNWKYDVSHHAANDLKVKTMNAVTIIPLASDIKKFRDYLIRIGEEAATKLKLQNNNVSAYSILLETVYCRIMLLCRKRPGELSRLTIDIYNSASTNEETYEEFAQAVRPEEAILMRKFKRVVVQGKRKITPILFSFDVQQHVELLLKVRCNFSADNNQYIFTNLRSKYPIVGYKVLKKHALRADLKNPGAITTRRLRKHLATISQILAMSEQDIEQLSSFMGHTAGIHRSEYRLPDGVFQTAKISKLLLMIEAGRASDFKGKRLDEINLDLEENLLNSGNLVDEEKVEEEEDAADGIDAIFEFNPPKCDAKNHSKKKNKKKIYEKENRKRNVVPWTFKQKQVVCHYFDKHIRDKIPPKKTECENLKKDHAELFESKEWVKIKVFVQNVYTNKSRNIL